MSFDYLMGHKTRAELYEEAIKVLPEEKIVAAIRKICELQRYAEEKYDPYWGWAKVKRETIQCTPVIAMSGLDKLLDSGVSLRDLCAGSDRYGHVLSVERLSENKFSLSLGCLAGECAGDGGFWTVEFNELGEVEAATGGKGWIA